MVDLPEDKREAAMNAITFPMHDSTPRCPTMDAVACSQFTLNQDEGEEITTGGLRYNHHPHVNTTRRVRDTMGGGTEMEPLSCSETAPVFSTMTTLGHKRPRMDFEPEET